MNNKPDRDDEIREELQFHLDTEQEELEASGLRSKEARLAAKRDLGNTTSLAETIREAHPRSHFENFLRDFRHAFRNMRREPGFTAAALGCLALGIGANTAVFSCVNAYLLQSLPYREPSRLVAIFERRPREGAERNVVSSADYTDWQQQSASFSAMAAYEPSTTNYTGSGEPERIAAAGVTASFFDVLGLAPFRGRFFTAEDEKPGTCMAIITHGFWQRHFGTTESVGRALTLDGRPCIIAGILPPDFVPPVRGWEILFPIRIDNDFRGDRGSHHLFVLARLKPGVTIGQAGSDLSVISKRLEQAYSMNQGHYANVLPLTEALRDELRPAMIVLLVTVALVLVIACFNVANLLLARSLVRAREIALRLTLGGSRMRIVRQLVSESVALGVAGGGLGVALAFAGVAYLRSILPQLSSIGPEDLRVDLPVLGFTAAISILAGILFGLAPAFTATRGSLSECIKSGGRQQSASKWHSRQRALILATQTGVAVLLLVGAGLLLRSFWNMQSVNPGFQADGLLTVQLSLPAAYREDARKIGFQREMIDRVRALPAVQSAGFTSFLPFANQNSRMGFAIDGVEPNPNEPRRANWRLVTPGYLETMKIPLLNGRFFQPGDQQGAPTVIVVNENAVRRYWRGLNPLGMRARLSTMKSWATVVGVVGDVKHWGLEKDAQPEAYLCSYQAPAGMMNLVVRTQSDPKSLAAAVRQQLRSVDSSIPTMSTQTMQDLISTSASSRRFLTELMAGFAMLALILAGGGAFAQVAYSVSQRAREIGIRVALGASRGSVIGLMMGHVLALVVAGGVLGVAASSGVSRFLQKVLFRVEPLDAATMVAATLLMILIAALACSVPSWRAAQSDPSAVLRTE